VLTIETPAKVNLTLEVLRKRPDGYHEIRSILQAVSLCDGLSFEEADGVHFVCDDPAWKVDKSLAPRAAGMLKNSAAASRGALVRITKRIPFSSGLGGDSSDAAATLTGLNRLWGLGLTPQELARLAGELGSDVTFFLEGGTALVRGRGELVSPLSPMKPAWIVLLLPPVTLPEHKTGALYSRLTPQLYSDGGMTRALQARLAAGEPIRSSDLYNVFENVAFAAFAGLVEYFAEFQSIAGAAVHLAGAGPTLFTLLSDDRQAARVCVTLKEKEMKAYLAGTQNHPGVC
jgi:4-diphosphocytidyl-2-C-methyl-D-erythritol kinase